MQCLGEVLDAVFDAVLGRGIAYSVWTHHMALHGTGDTTYRLFVSDVDVFRAWDDQRLQNLQGLLKKKRESYSGACHAQLHHTLADALA